MSKLLSYLRNSVKMKAIYPERFFTHPRAFSQTAGQLQKLEPPQSLFDYRGWDNIYSPRIYAERYKVLCKLSQNGYMNVWLVKDLRDGDIAAMKVMVGSLARIKADWDEVDRLSTLQKTNPRAPGFAHICQLRDYFIYESPDCEPHLCLVVEALQSSVYSVGRSSGAGETAALPLPLIKRVCRHALLALQYLHEECGIVHTDIKDRNILVCDTQRFRAITEADLMSATFKLSDFGPANTVENRFRKTIQPISLRAPEVIIGAEWDTKADIWNLGCLIYEFARGAKLFNPLWNNEWRRTAPALNHLAQISGLCGEFPADLLRGGTKTQKFFDDQGVLLHGAGMYKITLKDLLKRVGHPRDVDELSDFLSKMLIIDPVQRWSATQLLAHPWVNTP